MEEPQATGAPRHPLSGDGNWWWNGRRWIPAVTEDLLWQWDGAGWRPTIDLESKRPRDLAATLALLAEERHAGAGRILMERSDEWEPEEPLPELMERLAQIGRRLTWIQERLDPRRRDLRGRLRGLVSVPADPQRLEEERLALTTEQRALQVRLGRAAPLPSLKDADDLLVVARTLDARASGLTAALAALDEGERAHAVALGEAQAQLAAAEDGRRRALQEARRAVELAAVRHADRVRGARDRLRSALRPGAGDVLARFGPVELQARVLAAPGVRLPVAGLRAAVGTAEELWAAHRELVADLALSDAAGTEAVLYALTERSGEPFLFLWGRAGAAVVGCAGGVAEARRFAAQACELSTEAARVGPGRDAEARRAEEELRAVAARRPQVRLEDEVARVEADPELRRGLEEARERVERALADPPELADTRRRLIEAAREVTTPPPPLAPAGASGGPRDRDERRSRQGRSGSRRRPVAKPGAAKDAGTGDRTEGA